jgi:hypothetical protein
VVGVGAGTEDGIPEDASVDWLTQIAAKSVDRALLLTVYNRRYGESRQVTIFPSLNWGGDGLLGRPAILHDPRTVSSLKMLGCSIRFTSYSEILQDSGVFHVLDVQSGGPAEDACLNAFRDYVIASPDGRIHTAEEFGKLLHQFEDKWLSLIVYNVDLEACRHVWIRPTMR